MIPIFNGDAAVWPEAPRERAEAAKPSPATEPNCKSVRRLKPARSEWRMSSSLVLLINLMGSWISDETRLFNVSAKHRKCSAPNNDPVILRSECIEEFDHSFALRGIGKTSTTGAYIIGQMCWISGAGNYGGHRLVAKKKFQKELRPGRRVEIARPFRHALAANRGEYGASSKRQCRQDGSADICRRGKQPLFRFPVAERIVDLEEVRLFPAKYGFRAS